MTELIEIFLGGGGGGTLANYIIKGQLLDKIRALYQNCHSLVRTTAGLADKFVTTTGVYLRYVLSPLLFNVYIARIIKEVQPRKESLLDFQQEDGKQFAQ